MKEKLPLISVIVPTYNSPDLYGTLNSVITQDYPRMQLIVTDDASAFFSKEDTERYLQKNSKENLVEYLVIAHPSNLGTVRNLNRALEQCKGDIIFNLAGDDCFSDEKVLTDWVNAFLSTGAMVMTGYRAVYDEKLENFSHVEPTASQVEKIRTLSPEQLFEDIAATNYIFGCCTARTAQCVEKYGLFDERYRLLEDHPMNLKLLRMGERIEFFDRVVVKYRGGGCSSPLRYNAVYENDVNNVLTADVLPYTQKRIKMRCYFVNWKRKQRLLRRRSKLILRYGNRLFAKKIIDIWFYAHFPIAVLRKIVIKLFTITIKKRNQK